MCGYKSICANEREQIRWQIHPKIMRFLYIILLSLVLMAGCSTPEGTLYLKPTPTATATATATASLSQPGLPVGTKSAAIATGIKLLEERGGVKWIEPPDAIFVEEMSYVDANRLIGLDEAQNDLWHPETRVWLVIFKGRWQLIPLDPAQAAPQPVTYDGCGQVLFTASGGELISMGDAVCPAG